MALIVEDGTGLATAESYVSVADADTYFALYGAPALWTAASTADKETALRLATVAMDASYVDKWVGTKGSAEQALAWPRTGAVDADGYAIDADVIPVALERATAEMAVRSAPVATATLLEDVANPATIKKEKVVLGPMEKTTEFFDGEPSTPTPEYPLIDGILLAAGLITSSADGGGGTISVARG